MAEENTFLSNEELLSKLIEEMKVMKSCAGQLGDATSTSEELVSVGNTIIEGVGILTKRAEELLTNIENTKLDDLVERVDRNEQLMLERTNTIKTHLEAVNMAQRFDQISKQNEKQGEAAEKLRLTIDGIQDNVGQVSKEMDLLENKIGMFMKVVYGLFGSAIAVQIAILIIVLVK